MTKQDFYNTFKQQVLNGEYPEIQELLDNFKDIIPENKWENFENNVLNEFAKTAIEKRKFFSYDIINNEVIKDPAKSLTIKTYIVGLGKKFYRIMEIPYDITLADLAYFVLGSFKASGYHLFSIKYDKQIFADKESYSPYCASDVHLSQLKLQPKSQLEIEYDYGDCWLFKVLIQSFNDHDDAFHLEDSRIIKGKGYGIWEDDADLMYLYYRSYPLFLDAIHDLDMDEKDFVIKEFDLEEVNKNFISGYYHMKNMYQ